MIETPQIAIVGMSCLFPGAHTPEEFWLNLMEGVDSRREGTAKDFGIDPDDPGGWGDDAHQITDTLGGFVDDPEIDLDGLAIPPERLSDSGRVTTWSVYVIRQALASAGLSPGALGLDRTGLVFGSYSFPTLESTERCLPLTRRAVEDGLKAAGFDVSYQEDSRRGPDALWPASAPATLVADAFGLGGPRMAVDAACASALYSLSLGCEQLRTGSADTVVVGSVCAPDPVLMHLSFSDLKAYPGGQLSLPFHSGSKGIVTGQGAGCFVLRRLDEAIANEDKILALVDTVALGNDGSGANLLAPAMDGQIDVYRRAYENSNERKAPDYIECHATGTPVGDEVELSGIEKYFGDSAPLLGSVKGNVGHLLTVAGFTSILKVVLSLQHGVIPATPGLDSGELCGNSKAARRIVRTATDWPVSGSSRRAGVSSFGFGGVNAHVVLSSPDEQQIVSSGDELATGVKSLAVRGVGAIASSARTADDLAAAVRTGTSLIRDIPSQRWYGLENIAGVGPAPLGGYLEQVDVDFRSWRLLPNELEDTNPQHLAFFHAAAEALHEGGIPAPQFAEKASKKRHVAVVVAVELEPRSHVHRARFDIGSLVRTVAGQQSPQLGLTADQVSDIEGIVRDAVHRPLGTGEVLSYVGNIMASRVASAYDFDGPAFTIACAPADTAQLLDVASLLLKDEDLEAVLIGAVDLAAGVENTMAQRDHNGQVRTLGDGAAAILLSRSDEVKNPLAVVEGHSVNTGAEGVGEAVAGSLEKAGRSPNEVELLELTGTTENFGDLSAALGHADSLPWISLASTASLVGDTGRASFVLGLVAAIGSMQRAELPPTPEGVTGNPEDGAFFRSHTAQPWLRRCEHDRRVALVTGGERGHGAAALISADRIDEEPGWLQPGTPLLLPIHAEDTSHLEEKARDIASQLDGAVDLAALARSLADKPREAVCAVVVGSGVEEVQRELLALAEGMPTAHAAGSDWVSPSGTICPVQPIEAGEVAFVYPGAFTSYPGAEGELFSLAPSLVAALERETEDSRKLANIDFLYPRSAMGLNRRDLLRYEADMASDLPALLSVGTSSAILATRFLSDVAGVRPDAVYGYSLGESSMLFANEVWDSSGRDLNRLGETSLFRDELVGHKNLVRNAWKIPTDTHDREVWITKIVVSPVESVRSAIAKVDRVFLTHINSPKEVVIGGDPNSVKAVIDSLGAASAEAPADSVIHTPIAEAVYDELTRMNLYQVSGVDDLPRIYSAYDYSPILADVLKDSTKLAERIAKTLCQPIDFAKLTRAAYQDGVRYFVDVGPGTTCARWISDTLGDVPHVAVGIDRRGAGARATVEALARLYAFGLPINLQSFYKSADESVVDPNWSRAVICGGGSTALQIARTVPDILTPHPGTPVTMNNDVESAGAVEIMTNEFPPAVVYHSVTPLSASTRSRNAVSLPPKDDEGGNSSTSLGANYAGGYGEAKQVLAEMAETVARAHNAAISAQDTLVDAMLSVIESGVALGPVARTTETPFLDQSSIEEFASGSIAAVFGSEYSDIDEYSVRVRLPKPPYLFVTRVVSVNAVPGQFEPCSIVTEYDIPSDAWYLVEGLVPCAVTIEAGQCDLLLVSYLGVDRRFQGSRVYRLLDSKLVFHGPLPRAGQTLRYEIEITKFHSVEESLLFSFRYKCFCDGELILELLDGTAGFFSELELDQSGGVVDVLQTPKAPPAWFTPLARTDVSAIDSQGLEFLSKGQLAEVFGPEWDQTVDECNPAIRLPGRQLRMIDEIESIERLGGSRGLGELSARKSLDPDGWYFECHFPGDPVLAGSLIAEGGVQILQTYAMYLGLHLVLPDAEFQSVPGLETSVKVRGQVTPETRDLRYEVDVTDITLLPRPTITADIVVFDQEKPIVRMDGFGVQVRERPGTPYRPGTRGEPPFLGRRNHEGEAAFINELHLAHAARGDLGTAMGPEFDVYQDHRAPHIPNGDFRFVDRIQVLRGSRGNLTPGSQMESEYDCPPEAWYHEEGLGRGIPYCVLMESSLQAAVLLGYYLGATLDNPSEEYSIRNLGGTATVLRAVDLTGKTIHQTTSLEFSSSAGDVLQKFSYELSVDGSPFYRGESLFGYHRAASLVKQTGLDNGKYLPPWGSVEGNPVPDRTVEIGAGKVTGFERHVPSSGHLRQLDVVRTWNTGGNFDQGYVLGSRRVDPGDWYFECHFYRDPVMPGSLGVEAAIQAIRAWAVDAGHVTESDCVESGPAIGVPLTWKYRGQILRGDGEFSVDAHIKEVRQEDERLIVVADASLWKPGLRIYELVDLAIEFVPVDDVKQSEEEQK